ncbi:hypothetical protein [Scytonema sp. HK-05]|uniref:hypothetical protein n=1 Tax=Scytonema sp. HK-05 TaxID=1137095 RepID=UPI000AE0D745|nr:hypothetical protein [Scytonema sp. HK-05]
MADYTESRGMEIIRIAIDYKLLTQPNGSLHARRGTMHASRLLRGSLPGAYAFSNAPC